MLPLLIACPIAIIISYWIASSVAGEIFDRALAAKARSLAEHLSIESETDTVRLNVDLAMLLADDDAAAHAFRVDESDKLIFGNAALPRPSTLPANLAGQKAQFSNQRVGDARVRMVALKITPKGSDRGFSVQVSELMERRETLAREMLIALRPLQLLAIPIAAVLALLGLRRGIRPLRRLTEELARRRVGDFQPINVRIAPTEIVPLVDGFNALLSRVASENVRQKRFIDNAAHQLRTPLAGLQLITELALRSDDHSERQRALVEIRTAAQRSAHTIDQLLSLTRAEHVAVETFREVDLVQLVTECIEAYLPHAHAREIDLGASGMDTDAKIFGSAPLLRELIGNLIDNAIRMTPIGGVVTVGVAADETSRSVYVEDSGPGIRVDEREHIWERFYRGVAADGSQNTSGTGLGLAIVKEIADVHLASVRLVDDSAHAGARFQAVFPAYKRADV